MYLAGCLVGFDDVRAQRPGLRQDGSMHVDELDYLSGSFAISHQDADRGMALL